MRLHCRLPELQETGSVRLPGLDLGKILTCCGQRQFLASTYPSCLTILFLAPHYVCPSQSFIRGLRRNTGDNLLTGALAADTDRLWRKRLLESGGN